MKEITRVHIAGIQYDIEIEAKKVLQTYLTAIKNYSADEELFSDVEVRISELLAEQGIHKDNVITLKAVQKITAQLGDPVSFTDDSADIDPTAFRKKLYRDSGRAWIGGLAAGLALYFGTRAWWIRLLLVISIPVTSGISILLYILFWLIVPSTKTQADVLRANGKSVTVAKLSRLEDTAASVRPNRDQRIVRVVSIILGIFALIGSVVLICLATAAVIAVATHSGDIDRVLLVNQTNHGLRSWLYISAFALGLFSVVSVSLLSYVLISWRFKRAIVITLIVSFALAIASGISTAASVIYIRQQATAEIQRSVSTRSVSAPYLKNVADVVIDNQSDTQVQYVISDDVTPRIDITGVHGGEVPTVKTEDGKVMITVKQSSYGNSLLAYFPTTVTIYGPEPTSLTVRDGQIALTGDSKVVDSLNVTATDSANITATDLTITQLNAVIGQYANIDMTASTVQHVSINAAQSAGAQFGTIDDLSIKAPETCPETGTANFTIAGLNAATYSLNGNERGLQDYSSACVAVTFGGDQEDN